MAEEFANFMQETKKAPLEEKLNAFGDIVERMMSVILRIPDLVDQSLAGVGQRISTLESRFDNMNNELSALRTRGTGASPVVAAPSAPSSIPPPPGGPPGGPPSGPPPPPGGPGGPGAARPANPVSLRGAIMGELKQLFSKRAQSGQ
ncbi:MAG: hypothetical protein ACFFKA_07210 [Candidatus Thorarchaeota archaeon]